MPHRLKKQLDFERVCKHMETRKVQILKLNLKFPEYFRQSRFYKTFTITAFELLKYLVLF